jgi:hypothetical protein
VTVTVSGGGGGGGGSVVGGGGGGGGGVVVVIASCTGGAVVVVVSGVARLSVSVRVTNTDTEATRATAAMIAATPTTQGQRGGGCWSTSSVAGS